MFKSLARKSVIVTGGTQGIGKAIALLFAAKGARVMIVSRDSDGESASKIVYEIEQMGGEASFFKADVTQPDEMAAMAQAAIDRYGSLDILCSNVGIYPYALIEDLSPEVWDQVQSVNMKGVFLTVKACLPQMKKQHWGRIIVTSSITGWVTGIPGYAHYGASKAGLIGFVRSAALEFARSGITINAVLPGSTLLDSLCAGLGEEKVQQMTENVPMGELVDPENLAYAMLFLASYEAKSITGQALVIDGAETLPETVLMDAMGIR
jgi:3-oxoacyl-[acyl-carrier protein] reductase